ncbi:MAG: ATP-binding domain-containing protein, partial [Proteobacteria bacterium]|nr:ATP-binding domain-containing protein [Pseudomonadota bacterium]
RNVPLSNAWGIEGSPLTLRSFEDKEQEADWISHSLNEKKISGAALLDSAIIFTNTFYFEEILNALNKNEISFRVFGGTYFLDVNIKLFNALLTFINTENLYALQSILHQCGEYSLRVKTINQVLKIIDGPEKNKNINTKAMECLLFAIKHCEEKRLPLEILEDFAQLASDKQILDQEGLSACQHLKEIICNDLILNDYNELKFSIAPKHPELGKFYRRSDEIVPCSNKDDTDYVTVTTVHSAKGLQWDTVYLPGLYQGGVPRWFPDSKTEQRQLPEELKKFYVSCTRAQKNLYLTRPKKVTIKSKKDGCKHTFDKPISMFVNNLSVQNGRL